MTTFMYSEDENTLVLRVNNKEVARFAFVGKADKKNCNDCTFRTIVCKGIKCSFNERQDRRNGYFEVVE
jgi:hypothetical protein